MKFPSREGALNWLTDNIKKWPVSNHDALLARTHIGVRFWDFVDAGGSEWVARLGPWEITRAQWEERLVVNQAAQRPQAMNPIERLNEASEALHAAQQEHEDALAVVRDALPGYRVEVEPEKDMDDPANWRAGDVVECTKTIHDTSAGALYTLAIDPGDGELSFKDDAGDWCDLGCTRLRFHHRPK